MKYIGIVSFLIINFAFITSNDAFLKHNPSDDFLFKGRSLLEHQEPIDESPYEGNCYVNINNNIYDFNSVSNSNIEFKSKDQSKINLRFCSNANSSCPVSGMIIDAKKCSAYSSTWNMDKKWMQIRPNLLAVKFPPVEKACLNKGTKSDYSVTMFIRCEEKENGLFILNGDDFDTKECSNVILARSKYACSQNAVKVQPLSLIPGWVFAVYFCLAGLIVLSIGAFYPKVIMADIIFMIGAWALFRMLPSYIGLPILLTVVWLGASVAFSYYFAVPTMYASYALLTPLVSSVFFYCISSFPYISPNILFFLTLIEISICVVLLAIYLPKWIYLFFVSFAGSYFLIRGVSFISGNYPDEFYMARLVWELEFSQMIMIMRPARVYVIWISILTILGMIAGGIINKFTKAEKEDNTLKNDI